MRQNLGRLRTEPEIEEPPTPRGRDWLLAAVVAATSIVEAVLRDDMVWRPAAVIVGLVLACATLWRRSRPLVAMVLGAGAILIFDIAAAAADEEPLSLIAGVAVLVLIYAGFRWGTTRQSAIGSMMVLALWAVSVTTEFTGVTDAVGGLAVLLLVSMAGTAVRYQSIVRAQQLDRIRFDERDTIARDLHDTVAHHVTAIAVQAQAGRFLAHSGDPGGAAEALEVIEQEAKRALIEMRSMVGTLRRDHGASTTSPAQGLDDIDRLVTSEGARGLPIEVKRRGDLDNLRPAVQAALFRVAQESITNAKRHARHAKRVQIVVAGERDTVRLAITDDGERGLSGLRQPGYGLVGMAERVSLLGGTLEAGPGPDGGWTVRAAIPRQGGSA